MLYVSIFWFIFAAAYLIALLMPLFMVTMLLSK